MQYADDELHFLFVHLEPHLVDASRTERPARIGAAAAALALATELIGAPATFVHTVDDHTAGIGRLRPFATPANSHRAHASSAFASAAVRDALQAANRRTLVLAGYAAEVAVLHTALDAIAAGYRVVVPVDAVGSASPRTEAAALRRIERAGGEPSAALSVLGALAPTFTGDRGERLLALIGEIEDS